MRNIYIFLLVFFLVALCGCDLKSSAVPLSQEERNLFLEKAKRLVRASQPYWWDTEESFNADDFTYSASARLDRFRGKYAFIVGNQNDKQRFAMRFNREDPSLQSMDVEACYPNSFDIKTVNTISHAKQVLDQIVKMPEDVQLDRANTGPGVSVSWKRTNIYGVPFPNQSISISFHENGCF